MHRRQFTTAFAAIASVSLPAAATGGVQPQSLVGTWEVDLRPDPTAQPYLQTLRVEAVSGNTFTGTFYGADITEGRINVDWGAVRMAFVTADASGPYHHSAVLREGRLEGLTHSLGRKFLAYWSATKK